MSLNDGLFVVQEVGGRGGLLVRRGRLQDSSWIKDIDIFLSICICQVLFYSGLVLHQLLHSISNPKPDSEYGWLTRGMSCIDCLAIGFQFV